MTIELCVYLPTAGVKKRTREVGFRVDSALSRSSSSSSLVVEFIVVHDTLKCFEEAEVVDRINLNMAG